MAAIFSIEEVTYHAFINVMGLTGLTSVGMGCFPEYGLGE